MRYYICRCDEQMVKLPDTSKQTIHDQMVQAATMPDIRTGPGGVDMEPEFLRKTAMYHALRLGLSGPDAEDCASLFVLRFLDMPEDHSRSSQDPRVTTVPHHSAAWWHVYAKNHALNYRRGLLRRQRHFASWCDIENKLDEQAGAGGTIDSPLGVCLRGEVRAELDEVLCLFPERTRRLFVAHYLDGVRLECLAQEQRMLRNTVSQTLVRARARVRKHLEQRGWTQDEFVAALHGDH
jgi:RNA polymerase sigma factor (sigma-70 family)